MVQERDDECLDGGSEQEEAKGMERDGTESHLGIKDRKITSAMRCTWETSPFSHKHL